jgi:N-acetyllactosaminide beta-1,3-N-acetylglucosaminyltransferase
LLRRRDSFSPCRVLPFVVRSAVEATNRLPQVTLSTHATADQVYGIVELARRWDGPLSLAVFAPGLDAGLAVAQLDRACRCEPAMSKVSSISSARPRISRRTRNVLRACDFLCFR